MSFRSIIRDVRDSIGSFTRGRSEVRSSGTQSKSHGALMAKKHDQDHIVIQNSRWANIPPEFLGDVMKRLEESETARKHVVACAAVCRSWRKICKDTVKSPEFSAKLTFPVSVKQPGPREGTIQCFIKRDKSNNTFHLFVSTNPASLVDNGKFLLSAKRTRRITYSEYVISMDAVSSSSSTYIGKMRSNFLGTKFIIYDTAPAYNSSHTNRNPRLDSKKVSPNVPTGNYNIAEVTYELNVLGDRGPRRMHCIMHSIPALALNPDGTIPGQPMIVLRSPDESFRSIGSSKIIDNSGDFSSAPLVLRNKPPRWHQKLKCWCLNFRGRVTIASVKNFQLMEAATMSQKPGQSDHEKILLQFGRVGKDMFTMDYRYPLSAFQAFAICLSSFDRKFACE